MLLTLTDYERAAETRLPPPVWDFIAGGAGEDGTVKANQRAFASWRFRPRVAADVSMVNTSIELLGYCWQAPSLSLRPHSTNYVLQLGNWRAPPRQRPPGCLS
jgi:hypothetical protein